METFKFCPLHYKAKYLLKIPTPVYAAQSFGQTIHLTLRRFYLGLLQGESWNMDDLLRIYHDAWIPVGYTGQAHMEAMKKEGERELDAFYHSFHQDEPLPVVVEQPFAFHITPQLKIGGVIDRINRLSDGKIEIVDYKTATDVPTQKEVDKDSQLTVYALAATMAQDPRIASTPEEINLTLYYLGKGEKCV
jgi:DNA helicase-2/ATP-dependent DNA helicase PcrA